MIEHVSGNLLEADVEALVNTVNTVGVMGKGIALPFRQAFPKNYEAYRKACKHQEIQPGQMFLFATDKFTNPRYIINFPTKRHWKGKARIEDIKIGLRSLVELIKKEKINSIALPPLGCGNGGLDWAEVRPIIEKAFESLPQVRILLYAPEGAPQAEKMPIATKRPDMTPSRATLISLLNNYALPGYRLSMLEIQKLAYFLQVAGEPLKLKFEKNLYGPYAEALHHVLQRMEGHFIRGYGDRSRDASISLLSDASEEANSFLKNYPDAQERLNRVSQLIEGFETPYGIELLATVHWLAQENNKVKEDVCAAVESVHAWNEHKKKTFPPEHIRKAWSRLNEQKWI